MATYFESSDALYSSTSMSRSSSSTGASRQASPAEISPVPTSPMEGLQGVPIHHFTTIRDLRKCVRSHSAKLQAGRSNQQYLVFQGVTKRDLNEIDRERASIGKHTRMTHYADTNELIVKLMPSVEHELAHLTLVRKLDAAVIGMGLPVESLIPLGGTKFSGPNFSKEGDSAFKPLSRVQKADWPTLVFESGLSESLSRLRIDARLWLTHSGGNVKIVITISITPAERMLLVEKWCLSPVPDRPLTRGHPTSETEVPTRMQEVRITLNPPAPPNPAGQSGTSIRPSATTQQSLTI
ncbi:hypothetical protein K469DRAFT_706356 [Zopfia rhizophila CBS 207.26]|uniref:Uncharacterized protein n=1 Tax=Zopfia rhizophila CBS 207.26 TaxID=1314779 RepID=A0A6A6ETG6_9PEZI|nr:hypothetical protein K469DRAFT_706356 [Zopfia rhizophila CBS 207.26]